MNSSQNSPTDPKITVEDRTVDVIAAELIKQKPAQGAPYWVAAKVQAESLYRSLLAAGVLKEDEPELEPVAISLTRTSIAAPEQYDVFRDGRQIGYLRLRHGHFRAHYPDHLAPDSVYDTGVRGDGSFYDDEERATELRAAAIALLQADGIANPDPQFEIPPYEIEDEDWDSSPLFEMLAQQRAEREAIEAERKQANDELLRRDLESMLQDALSEGASVEEIIGLLESGGFIAEPPRLSLAGRLWEPTELKPKSLTVVLQPGEFILRADLTDFGPHPHSSEHNQIVATFIELVAENFSGQIAYKDVHEAADVNELFNGYEANEIISLELEEY